MALSEDQRPVGQLGSDCADAAGAGPREAARTCQGAAQLSHRLGGRPRYRFQRYSECLRAVWSRRWVGTRWWRRGGSTLRCSRYARVRPPPAAGGCWQSRASILSFGADFARTQARAASSVRGALAAPGEPLRGRGPDTGRIPVPSASAVRRRHIAARWLRGDRARFRRRGRGSPSRRRGDERSSAWRAAAGNDVRGRARPPQPARRAGQRCPRGTRVHCGIAHLLRR